MAIFDDLAVEIRMLELLQQPDPVKALTDYFAAIERRKGGRDDVQQGDPCRQPDPRS